MVEFVVCDDESNVLEYVSKIINHTMEKYDFAYQILTFSDYDKRFNSYITSNNKQVVYILDLEMPSQSGVQVARQIRNDDKNSIIIILTSHHESADTIYKGRLNILTFISKRDRTDENLSLAIDESLLYFKEKDELIEFSDFGNNYKINAMDIYYMVKDGRKTLIKTEQNSYEVYTTLGKFKDILPDYFKQTHRACIVNMKRVVKINFGKKIISFDNGTTIDYIGDKYKKGLM